MSSAEAGQLIGKSVCWMERKARAGLIPGTKVGRTWRFTEEHVAAILAAGERRPMTATPDRTVTAIEKVRAAMAAKKSARRAA